VLIVLAVAFSAVFVNHARIGTDLKDRSSGLVFPGLAVLAMAGVFLGMCRRYDRLPFVMTVAFFVGAFLTLAVLFWPHMIPYQVTVANAVAAGNLPQITTATWKPGPASGSPRPLPS
jgi:cytochrome bd ubiquinol oxidase subunit II